MIRGMFCFVFCLFVVLSIGHDEEADHKITEVTSVNSLFFFLFECSSSFFLGKCNQA